MAHIPAGTSHKHHNDGAVDEVHLEVLGPGFSYGAANLTFVDDDGEWEPGGTVVHLPDPGEWSASGGARSYAFSDPSGTLGPAFPGSLNATLVVARGEPGSAGNPPMHVHRFEQLYFVTEGTLHVDIALDHYEAGPSSLVIIPAGVPHREAPGGSEIESHLVMNVAGAHDTEYGAGRWDTRSCSVPRTGRGRSRARSVSRVPRASGRRRVLRITGRAGIGHGWRYRRIGQDREWPAHRVGEPRPRQRCETTM